MNDVLIVVPGILGSSLYRDGRAVWDVAAAPLVDALRSWFRSLNELRLPAGIGDEAAADRIVPKALIADVRLPLGLWTFDVGYTKLVRFLKNTFGLNDDPERGPRNLVTFPYDWRLSNRYNGAALKHVAEQALGRWRDQGGEYAEAKLVFICHSMGGLVARRYIDGLGGAAQTRALITLGTPHRGALNALDQLSNGPRKGPAAYRAALSELGRSLPSLYQLLPEYACVEHGGSLRKTTELDLPGLETARVRDAMAFHLELDAGRQGSAGAGGDTAPHDGQAQQGTKPQYGLHPIGGFKQRTLTTARLAGSGLECLYEIGGTDERGDGTVPRLSFTPRDLSPAGPEAHFIADNHGGLVHNGSVFDQLEGILTANPVVHLGVGVPIAVDVPEILDPGEPLRVSASFDGMELPIEAVVASEAGTPLGPSVRLLPMDGVLGAAPPLPGPGVYQVTIRGVAPHGVQVSPITTVVLAWPGEETLG